MSRPSGKFEQLLAMFEGFTHSASPIERTFYLAGIDSLRGLIRDHDTYRDGFDSAVRMLGDQQLTPERAISIGAAAKLMDEAGDD